MYFGISAFQIRASIERWTAMSRTGNVNDIGITLFDEAVQMNVNKVLSRGSSPVSKQPWFDLLCLKRLSQEGILE
jgi:hypothetical protein